MKSTPFDEVLNRASARYRIFGRYYLVFGIAALFLSVIGLYSIMSFGVANRQTEIGIRLALGARGGDVLRQVLGEGFRQVGLGLAIGAVLAVWLTAGLSQILYQVERWDLTIACHDRRRDPDDRFTRLSDPCPTGGRRGAHISDET